MTSFRQHTDSLTAEYFYDTAHRTSTKAIFKDLPQAKVDACLYLTRPVSDEHGASLREAYLEIADPTEYKFALEIFKDFKHWNNMKKSPGFVEELNKWREELKVKLRSQAVQSIIELSIEAESDAQRLAASKWLAQFNYSDLDVVPNKVGRPKKSSELNLDTRDIRADMERLNLDILVGGKDGV